MSTPLEHDYIGLTGMEHSSGKISSSSSSSSPSSSGVHSLKNEKETELRLGLPGSQSPERNNNQPLSLSSVSLFGKELEDSHLKTPFSGAKRGFPDASNGSSAKWGLSVTKNGFGTETADLVNGKDKDALFSPRGGKLVNQLGSTQDGASVPLSKSVQEKKNQSAAENEHLHSGAPAAKAQVVGWPPIRSFRKNTMASNTAKKGDGAETNSGGCLYVKVSMDGAPYLRKVNLKAYKNYMELSSALEKMFSCFTIGQCGSNGIPGPDGISKRSLKDLLHGSEYVLTYEDKDGDWMLVGDVPWQMFAESCRRLRIMKGSEATGFVESHKICSNIKS